MKHLKLFEDIVPAHQSESDYRKRNTDQTTDVTKMNNIPLRSPSYQKGEIIIWSNDKDVDYDFAKKLLKRVGLELIGEPYDQGFLIKCEPGKEEELAQKAIDKFPEFFHNYEREDIRLPFITNRIEELNDKILGIEDFFVYINKKNVNIKKYNEYIDDIINDLNNIKVK